MTGFYVEPEVAGGLGPNTVMDRSTHPPVVHKLHYEFDGWLGDELLETFPAFIVTDNMRSRIEAAGLTGTDFAPVEVSLSETFRELHPGRELPPFHWLKLVGQAGHDDFGAAPDGRLIVSERALKLLQSVGIANALVDPAD